jgi:hypothetical protein
LTFQLAGHEPIFRVHRIVLAFSSTGVVLGPSQRLPPVPVNAFSVFLDSLGRAQTQLQCRRFDRAEDQCLDVPV